MASIKIITDSQCDIYIDGDFISNIEPNKLKKISLEAGEYWVQIVCCSDTNKKYEEVVNLQYDKVIKTDFKNSPDYQNPEVIKTDTEQECDTTSVFSAIDLSETKQEIKKVEPLDKVLVKQKGKYCILDVRENTPITDWYDNIESHLYIHTKVEKAGKYGLIDSNGKEIVPCIYDEIGSINEEGFVRVRKNCKYGIVAPDGRETVPCIYDEMEEIDDKGFVVIKTNGKYGTIDCFGKQLIQPFSAYKLYFFEGLASDSKKGKSGYINGKGENVIQCIYDDVDSFNNGYATVRVKDTKQIIDKTGNVTYSDNKNYDSIDTFLARKGFAIVSKDDKDGIISVTGKVIAPCIYDDIDFGYHDDKPITVCIDEKYGWLDTNGKKITPCKYDEIKSIESNANVTFARLGSKYGLIDIEGEELTEFIYDSCEDYPSFNNDLVWVERNGKFGYINTKGEEVIPCIYDEADAFYFGFAAVKENKTWNLINCAGTVVIPHIGKDTYAMSENIICLKHGYKFGIADLNGKEILPFIYDEISEW